MEATEGNCRKNGRMEWVVTSAWMGNKACPALAHGLQADPNKACPALAHGLQADPNTLVAWRKGHLLPKCRDSSIQQKDVNWLLRMCHYIVIGVYEKTERNGAVLVNHEGVFGLKRTGRHVKEVLGETNEMSRTLKAVVNSFALSRHFHFSKLFSQGTPSVPCRRMLSSHLVL
jgi:hypothetical protein